jgi:uncharacterized membrane protein
VVTIAGKLRIKILLFFLAPCTLLLAGSPVFASQFESYRTVYPILKYFFHFGCHQRLARSIIVHNLPLLVCARCTGIYTGFTVGLLISPLLFKLRVNSSRKLYLLLMLPVIIDVFGILVGLWQYDLLRAALTGLPLGSAGALLIYEFFLPPKESCRETAL